MLRHFCGPAESIAGSRWRAPPSPTGSPWTINVSRGGFVKPAEPAENLVRVRMGRHGFDELDARVDGNHLAVNLDRLLAVDELPAASARRLVSDEEDRVARVRQSRPSSGEAPVRRSPFRWPRSRWPASWTASAASIPRRSKSCGTARCKTHRPAAHAGRDARAPALGPA